MKTKSLPGFKGIEFIESRRLFVNFREPVREGGVVEASGNFTVLPVAGLIGCQVTSEPVSGETVYTTLLNFTVPDCGEDTRRTLHDLSSGCYAFRLTDVYGEKYLLGLSGKPHPMLKPAFLSEEKPSGGRVFSVEIRYTHTHSILRTVMSDEL